jgi:transcription antitermination factor NusG
MFKPSSCSSGGVCLLLLLASKIAAKRHFWSSHHSCFIPRAPDDVLSRQRKNEPEQSHEQKLPGYYYLAMSMKRTISAVQSTNHEKSNIEY